MVGPSSALRKLWQTMTFDDQNLRTSGIQMREADLRRCARFDDEMPDFITLLWASMCFASYAPIRA